MQSHVSNKTKVGNRVSNRDESKDPNLVRLAVPTAKLEVDVQTEGGRIESIIVTCVCGEKHVVHCEYPEPTAQPSVAASNPVASSSPAQTQ